MVRVDPSLVLAPSKPVDAGVEVVEGDREVPWVAAGRFQPKPRRSQDCDPDEHKNVETDQGCLLGQLIHGDVARSEDRDAVGAIDRVVALGVGPEPSASSSPPRTTTVASSSSTSPGRRCRCFMRGSRLPWPVMARPNAPGEARGRPPTAAGRKRRPTRFRSAPCGPVLRCPG